jgi:hypothetical protein
MLDYSRVLAHDSAGNHLGMKLGRQGFAHGKAYDSTGAFLIGELERLDQKFHGPLVAVTWQRDIQLREDVSLGNEVSSFITTFFASPPAVGDTNLISGGKSWHGRSSNERPRSSVDEAKQTFPLRPWSEEAAYSVFELESAILSGRPIDEQKLTALNLKHQMDIDAQVYVGDVGTGDTGLINNAAVTPQNVAATGVSGGTTWASKIGSPQLIVADINNALETQWANAAFAVMSDTILVPPAQYGLLASTPFSITSGSGTQSNGGTSLLTYVLENNILTRQYKRELKIFPVKWAIGAGVGGTLGTTGTVDRMLVYSNSIDFVRFPMVPMQRMPLQFRGVDQIAPYYCKLGVVELVYPQTVGAYDGI